MYYLLWFKTKHDSGIRKCEALVPILLNCQSTDLSSRLLIQEKHEENGEESLSLGILVRNNSACKEIKRLGWDEKRVELFLVIVLQNVRCSYQEDNILFLSLWTVRAVT